MRSTCSQVEIHNSHLMPPKNISPALVFQCLVNDIFWSNLPIPFGAYLPCVSSLCTNHASMTHHKFCMSSWPQECRDLKNWNDTFSCSFCELSERVWKIAPTRKWLLGRLNICRSICHCSKLRMIPCYQVWWRLFRLAADFLKKFLSWMTIALDHALK